jgi:hypothetical protein
MKKVTILVEVISTLGALASILWLFLAPGPEPFAASLIALAAILGIGVQAQAKLAKVLDESLSERLLSIQEIRKVTDNIPRVTANELFKKLKDDKEFLGSFTSRLLRVFGLRRELVPVREPELINLIDNELEPLFDIGVGQYSLKEGKLKQFATLAVKLTEMVRTFEAKLMEEHRKRFNFG